MCGTGINPSEQGSSPLPQWRPRISQKNASSRTRKERRSEFQRYPPVPVSARPITAFKGRRRPTRYRTRARSLQSAARRLFSLASENPRRILASSVPSGEHYCGSCFSHRKRKKEKTKTKHRWVPGVSAVDATVSQTGRNGDQAQDLCRVLRRELLTPTSSVLRSLNTIGHRSPGTERQPYRKTETNKQNPTKGAARPESSGLV